MIRRKLLILILASLAAAAAAAAAAPARAQSLDPAFGSGGVIVGIPFPGYFTGAGSRLLALGSGQFVLAVAVNDGDPAHQDIGIVRYFGDGTVDSTFGDNGYAVVDWDPDAPDWASAGMAVDHQGRIVVVGHTGALGVDTDAAVAVLTAAGYLDPSFDSDGKRIVPDLSAVSIPAGVIVDAQDSIVFDLNAAAACCVPDSSRLLRYLPDGTEDTGFMVSGDGDVSTLALDRAGRVVWADAVTDGTGIDLTVRRLDAGAGNDPAFNAGQPVTDFLSTVSYAGIGLRRAVVQSDNAIVMTGGPSFAFHAWRYSAAGQPDASFGIAGHTDIVIPMSAVTTALVDDQDRILLVGYADTGASLDFVVVRLTAGGLLDTSFNGTGIFTVDVSAGSDDVARDAILMPDGDLVIAGEINGSVAVGIVRIDMGAPQSMISNGGFELSDSAQPGKALGWTGASLTKDKRRCLPNTAVHAGNCAFVFKGSGLESASITQQIKPDASLRRAGTVLTLSAWASSTATPALAKVTVYYKDGSKDAFSLSVGHLPAFTQFVSAPFVVAKDAKKFKITFRNTALAGTLILDDVALMPNTLRVRAEPLAVPLPPRYRSIER